jgi:hypothetical protein
MSRKKQYTFILEVIELGQSEARKPKERLEKKMAADMDAVSFVLETENKGETEIISVHGISFLLKEDYENVLADWLTE